MTELYVGGTRSLLAWQALVSSVGIFLSSSLFALFLVGPAGVGDASAGLVLVFVSLMTVIASIPAGKLIRKIGARNFAVVSTASRGLLLIALPLSANTAWTITVLLAFGVCEAAAFSVYQIIIAEQLGESGRVKALAIRRTLGNLGFSLGGILVGFVVGIGTDRAYSLAFLGSGVALIISTLFVLRIPQVNHSTGEAYQTEHFRSAPLRDTRFLIMIVSASIMATSTFLLTIGVPLWLVRNTQAPDWMLGVLLVTNTVLVVLFQVRLSTKANSWSGARSLVIAAGIAFGLSVALLALTDSVSPSLAVCVLIVSTAIAAVAEMWDSAGWWTLAFGYPSETQRPDYLAVFDVVTPVSSIIGPPLMMWIVGTGDVGWLVYAALFFAASALAASSAHRRP